MRGEEKGINKASKAAHLAKGGFWCWEGLETFRLSALQGNQFKVIRGETVTITPESWKSSSGLHRLQ